MYIIVTTNIRKILYSYSYVKCAQFLHILLYSFPLLINYLDDHPHLFAVDPLLVHFMVHASPLDKYGELVSKVPLFMLLAALAEHLSKEVNEKVTIYVQRSH